jgi:hypothetical protein
VMLRDPIHALVTTVLHSKNGATRTNDRGIFLGHHPAGTFSLVPPQIRS